MENTRVFFWVLEDRWDWAGRLGDGRKHSRNDELYSNGWIGNGVLSESWGWGAVGRAEHGCSEKL